jgi:hypothetical protein
MVGAGCVIAVGLGAVSAKLVAGGLSALHPINPPAMPGGIVLFPLLLLLPALWRWPRAGLVALLAGTTLVDQFQYRIGPTTRDGPSYVGHINVPLFRSLSRGSFVTPVDIVLFVLILIWLMKGAPGRSWFVPRSPLAKSIAALYGLAIAVGCGLGLARGGQLKVILWELRPWYYLAIMYVLTSAFFARRDVFRPLLWTIVLGSGVKSLEGVVNYFTIARRLTPRPEEILSHEEAFFFGVFLLATLALWLFQVRGRLRTVATAFAPLVLIADLGNSRRTAFLILYAGVAAILAVAYVGMPERRRVLKGLNLVVGVAVAIYLAVFWSYGGTLGQPARAVHSAVAPDTRDLASNQYRYIENSNLQFNIHATRSVGKGFGIPINYGYATIVDLSKADSMIPYVPHNGVLYVWYRLGIIGEIVLWSMVGFVILAGCRLARRQSRELAALGAIAVCAILAYVFQGYNDLGFSWLRIAIFMGFMLGALEAAQSARADLGRV